MRANRLRGPLGAVALALAGLGLTAGPAAATFHEISIREVYAGSTAQPGSQYVELQAWSPGQNFLGGHSLKTYDEGGNVTGTTTFAGMVPNGANQMTVLIATPAAEAEFGMAADKGLTGTLSPSGGAVCWENLDCISWGGFSGALPSPAGPPAAAIADAQALRRTISPGCPTLLEAADDHDNSAADLSAVFPAPRPNAVAPSERSCARPGGQQSEGSGTGGGRGAPQTALRRRPAKRIADRTPTFRFGSDEAKSTFQCKVDAKPFRACRSPFTTKQLALGRHVFRVRARDESGKLDPTPAAYSFRVIARK